MRSTQPAWVDAIRKGEAQDVGAMLRDKRLVVDDWYVDPATGDEFTPLGLAIQHRRHDTVERLVDFGAPVGSVCRLSRRRTTACLPLGLAIECNSAAIVVVLLLQRRQRVSATVVCAADFIVARPSQPTTDAAERGLSSEPPFLGDILVLMKENGGAEATIKLDPSLQRITFGRGEDCHVRINQCTVAVQCELLHDWRHWYLRRRSLMVDTVSRGFELVLCDLLFVALARVVQHATSRI